MKGELKQFVWIIGLGMALTAFGFANFATKGEMNMILDGVKRVEGKVDSLLLQRRRKSVRK